jgi:hypothetical protein
MGWLVAGSDAGPLTEEPEAPHASNAQKADVGRALITIALAWGTLGLSIPFGSESGQFLFTINPLEIFLSVLAFIGAVGLLVDFWHPWRSWLWRVGFAEMAVGFLWTAASIYELIVPSAATFQWRLGHSLIYGGYAILALTTWRWINKGNTREQ